MCNLEHKNTLFTQHARTLPPRAAEAMKYAGHLRRPALVTVASVLLTGCGLDLFLADRKIDSLCKVDGGVTVYVKDKAPTAFLRPDGLVDVNWLREAKDGEYYIKSLSTTIQAGTPSIVRSEDQLFRKMDGVLMGKAVYYLRPGLGGFNFTLFPQYYECPSSNVLRDLVDATFERR